MIPLELLNNPKFTSRLFTGKVDRTNIQKITYIREFKHIEYEKYNPETNTYSKVFTDERVGQFMFSIYLENVITPIKICCEDCGQRDFSNIYKYQWIPALSTSNSDRILYNLFVNCSLNDYDYYLDLFGKILAFIVNNNIVLLEEKVLTSDTCCVNLTKYDSSENIILFFPCLHTVSNSAELAGNFEICPMCKQKIVDKQTLTFEDFTKILNIS
jgi:hypothetical protein